MVSQLNMEIIKLKKIPKILETRKRLLEKTFFLPQQKNCKWIFLLPRKIKKDVFWDVLSCKNGGNVFHDTSLIWENDFAKDEKNTK